MEKKPLNYGRTAPTEFDLILMDVLMPELDGLEATAAIRKIEQETGQHIPIVAVTAHGNEGRSRNLSERRDE